jgi:hypothetical protein
MNWESEIMPEHATQMLLKRQCNRRIETKKVNLVNFRSFSEFFCSVASFGVQANITAMSCECAAITVPPLLAAVKAFSTWNSLPPLSNRFDFCESAEQMIEITTKHINIIYFNQNS